METNKLEKRMQMKKTINKLWGSLRVDLMKINAIPLLYCYLTAFSFCIVKSSENSHSSIVKVPTIPLDTDWESCSLYKHISSLPNCLCNFIEDEGFRVNCDHIVFPDDFPRLPFRQPIVYFSNKYVNNQNLPPQSFLASKIPLRMLDLSHNWFRRLPDKSLDGLAETLEALDLSNNKLGDQLNPIFSTSEFKRLPRLRILSLAENMISHIDSGILNGCLSMQEFYLNGNELKAVPKTALKGPNALQVLDISSNKIDALDVDDFAEASSLVYLNMSDNRIMQIEGRAFQGLSSLKIIDLSLNRIHRLNSDSFAGLTAVEEVDLSDNFLTQIPLTALKLLRTMKVLKLSGNLLQNFEGVKIEGWSHLEVLDLSRNRLSDLPRGFFDVMINLRVINLGVNQLRTLPQSMFEKLSKLHTLNLMDNNLLGFPSAAITPLTSLKTLILDYNRISVLSFDRASNITKLSLAHNLIREIPSITFDSFEMLDELNLRGNLIASLDNVQMPSGLRRLDLGWNSLTSIPRFQMFGLEVLKLDKNLIHTLLQHNFVLLSNLEELDLGSNNITSCFENSFDGLNNLQILDLSDNKLNDIPNLSGMEELNRLYLSKNRINKLDALKNMENLQYLDLSKNAISNMRPTSFRNTTSLVDLNLSGNKLHSFKGFLGNFKELKSLNLRNNHITYVYPSSFESFERLWNLDLSGNNFNMFPTEFLKFCDQLRYVSLSGNHIKNLNEMNFSNFPHLRGLDLSQNILEFVIPNAFINSTQLQQLDLSGNKLENLEGDLFHGILRLELDLSNNYLSYLPQNIFERTHVQKLHKINLAQNGFRFIPSDVLQKQYFYLEELNMSENKISEIVSNLNILVNVKDLDLSFNPIDEASLKNILTEPKTVRSLKLANCSIKSISVLEMPFLRSFNLSHNHIQKLDGSVFKRATLLQNLDISYNNFYELTASFPGSLTSLDVSGNKFSQINGNHFPQALEHLRLIDLPQLVKVEKSSLNLKNLKTLKLYNLQKLGYLDIRGLLAQLHYLESFDFEVKDQQIVDQIHPGLNARVNEIGLRGRKIRAISTGALAGLTSSSVKISLVNTSLSILPSILVPVPMSSNILLDLTGSKISNLSPPFLSQKIKLEGLTPFCDCNAVTLVRYLQSVNSDVLCSGPPMLNGVSVLSLSAEDLVCESGSSTPIPPQPSTIKTTTTTEDDIIWSLPTSTGKPSSSNRKISKPENSNRPKLSAEDINNMDNLIIGIVGAVIALIVLFVVIIVCFVKLTGDSGSSSAAPFETYPPPAPSVISVGMGGYAPSAKCTCPPKSAGSLQAQQAAAMMNYATVRSNGKLFAPYPSISGYNYNGALGGIYAVHPNFSQINGGTTGGPGSLSSIPISNAFGTLQNNGGPPSLRQQQLFSSTPYLSIEDYENRR